MTTTVRLCCVCGAAAHWEHPDHDHDLCVGCHHNIASTGEIDVSHYTILPEDGGPYGLACRAAEAVVGCRDRVPLHGTTGFETQANDLDGGAA